MKRIFASRRRVALGAVLIAVAGICFGGYFLSPRSLTASSVPRRPDLAGWQAELQGRIAKGESLARSFLRSTEGLVALSRLYHANGFYREALQCYDGLRKIEPAQARWPHLQARILAEFGRLDQAIPAMRRAVELDPAYVPSRLRLGDILLKANQDSDAARCYSEVLIRDPDNPYALLGLARCDLVRNDWSKARERLQQAVRRHPDFVGALSLLVTVSEHFGDKAQADDLRTAIGLREFVDFADSWADGLSSDCYDAYRLSITAGIANFARDVPTARHLLERAIELAPDNGSYRRQLSLILSRLGERAAARRHLETAVAVSPNDADSWWLLAKIQIEMNEPKLADETLRQGLMHCPLSSELRVEHARRLRVAGRIDQAIVEYREAHRLRPNDATTAAELASVYVALQRIDEAQAVLKVALQNQPEHPIALATFVLCSIYAGDEAAARSWWDRVRRQPRTPPEAARYVRNEFQRRFGRALP